nr:hypothetical protein Q903MT_gene6123 [Picea sitchensis]
MTSLFKGFRLVKGFRLERYIYIYIYTNRWMGLNGTNKMTLNRMRYRETYSKRFGSSKLTDG